MSLLVVKALLAAGSVALAGAGFLLSLVGIAGLLRRSALLGRADHEADFVWPMEGLDGLLVRSGTRGTVALAALVGLGVVLCVLGFGGLVVVVRDPELIEGLPDLWEIGFAAAGISGEWRRVTCF